MPAESLRGTSMVLGSTDAEMKQIKVNAYEARGLQQGRSVEIHSRAWLIRYPSTTLRFTRYPEAGWSSAVIYSLLITARRPVIHRKNG